MSASRPATSGTTLSTRLRLSVGDLSVEAPVTVPADAVRAEAVLPSLQRLVDQVVETAEAQSRQAGAPISCRKGCGACCRQLVPVSRTEARAIAALVAALPPGRRAKLRARFADVARQLHDAGLAPALLDPARREGRPDRALSVAYFGLGIACPFLEDEACSVHRDRPLACREYLVTSPAERCRHREQDGVTPVAVPKLSVAARGLDSADDIADTTAHWVPLALALEHEASTPQPRERLSGPQWIQRFLGRLRIGSAGGRTA